MTDAKADHDIALGPDTVHGTLLPERGPVVEIDPGDTVSLATADVAWGVGQHVRGAATRPRVAEREPGPCMTGPIAVRGARPGDVLAVEFLEIRPGTWGWTQVNGFLSGRDVLIEAGFAPDESDPLLLWSIDVDDGVAESEVGHRVRVCPFLGTVGVASPDAENAWHPGPWGGNMDCTALTRGSTLLLPAFVEGAMLSMGDGHARQGDGEVAGSAIECPMDRIVVRLDVRRDLELDRPRIFTAAGEIVVPGFGDTLEGAQASALGGVADLLVELSGCLRTHAFALASAVVDFRVTQIANGVVGVHGVVPSDFVR